MRRAWSKKNLWEKAPGFVRTSVGRLLQIIPTDRVLGGRFRTMQRFVDEAQWWSADQNRAYQLEQLRRICSLAYEKTDYYRRSFDEAGFRPEDLKQPEDLAALPLIDRTVVSENAEAMCAVSPHSPGIDFVTTGGTSGAPLRFWVGAERSAVEYAYLVAGWQRVGYRLDMAQAVIRGQLVSEDRNGLRHEYDPLLRRHYYSNFHMTDENMGRYLDHIRGIGPCFLHVYPSSVVSLARYIQRSGRAVPDNIRGILAGSETVTPEERKLVEQTLGVRYFSWYGHSEKLVMAAECEHSSDYHVWPTYGYFELVDDTGNIIDRPGVEGEIVGTGFINSAQPFVRYRTGDYATYVADRCDQCGRAHPILRPIRGHGGEGIVGLDGQTISATTLLRAAHSEHMGSLTRYQIYQEQPGEVELRVMLAPDGTEQDARKLVESLAARTDGQVCITLAVVDDIPLTKRGKQRYVISRIEQPTAAE